MKPRALSVALDGPAGVGKSTLARRLAARLGLSYVDTGAMYRAVALEALEQGIDMHDARRLGRLAESLPIRFRTVSRNGDIENRVYLGQREITRFIRTQRVSDAASVVSAHPAVRRALVKRQQALAGEGAGVVMEGRDIGTVVLPGASVKFFLTADAKVRAKRRWKELVEHGDPITFKQVLADTKARDRRDSEREDSPLVQAPDAIRVSTTQKTPEQLLDVLESRIRKRTILNGSGGGG